MTDSATPPDHSLLATIQRGGPLAALFQQAAGETLAPLRDILRGTPISGWLELLAAATRQKVAEGTAASPLVVLRQCGAGCSACCHTVSADVTPLEALMVAAYLQQTYSPQQLRPLKARLAENAAARQEMTAEERRRVRLRCGLLSEDGLCSVYPVRPLVCAGVFSLLREACEAAYRHADLAGQTIPLDRPAKAWTMGVSGGLQRALVEAELDGNLYELNSIVLVALETPRAAQRWLAGEDIFAAAVCTDAHSPPRKQPPAWRLDTPQPPPKPHILRPARRDREKLLRRKRAS